MYNKCRLAYKTTPHRTHASSTNSSIKFPARRSNHATARRNKLRAIPRSPYSLSPLVQINVVLYHGTHARMVLAHVYGTRTSGWFGSAERSARNRSHICESSSRVNSSVTALLRSFVQSCKNASLSNSGDGGCPSHRPPLPSSPPDAPAVGSPMHLR